MQELAEQDYKNVPVPRRIKISSKRQITIPVDIYNRMGFSEYALITETDNGMMIQPMELADDDEQLTIQLLRYLIDKGCEGDELLRMYKELKPKFTSYYKAIERSEEDIAAGRTIDFDEMQERLSGKYGL